jgi:hypothetical protein
MILPGGILPAQIVHRRMALRRREARRTGMGHVKRPVDALTRLGSSVGVAWNSPYFAGSEEEKGKGKGNYCDAVAKLLPTKI